MVSSILWYRLSCKNGGHISSYFHALARPAQEFVEGIENAADVLEFGLVSAKVRSK
jgi:hypothetical protein